MQTLKRTTAERSRALLKRYAVCTIGYGKVRFFMHDTLLYDTVRFVLYDTFLYVSRRFYGFCTIGFFPNKYIYCRVFNGYEWHKFKEIYVYWQSKIWNVLNDGLINKNLPDNVPVCGNGPTTTNVNLPVKAVN